MRNAPTTNWDTPIRNKQNIKDKKLTSPLKNV